MSDTDSIQAGLDGKVTVTFDGSVAVVTMDCGENRANKAFVEKMLKALDEVQENADVKAVITIGEGKFYSNGLDLDWLTAVSQEGGQEKLVSSMEAIGKLSHRVLTFPVPTIAAMNGHTIAFGSVFSLCHDYRIMRTGRGWWHLNEVFNGLAIHPKTRDIIKSKLPVRTFHEATVMGRRYSGEEALDAGIVHQISPPGDLLKDAVTLAGSILPRSGAYIREALQMMKEDTYGDPSNPETHRRKVTKQGVESRL